MHELNVCWKGDGLGLYGGIYNKPFELVFLEHLTVIGNTKAFLNFEVFNFLRGAMADSGKATLIVAPRGRPIIAIVYLL